MKPLNELIDAVGFANEPTKAYALAFVNEDETQYIQVQRMNAYEAGHRACFDLLAPALKEAIEAVGGFSEDGEGEAKRAIHRIRKILEGQGK